MILVFTDFGRRGPYVGQVEAVLAEAAPGVPVVELLSDAPAFDPRASAYLLAALVEPLPAGAVVLAVVDPGVGGPRRPMVLRAGGRWYVGPDNGLLALVARRAGDVSAWEITWRPERLSATFHGRDLFAPVAARLARGEPPPGEPLPPGDGLVGADWPDDLAEIVYVDGYGNAATGLRAGRLAAGARLEVAGRILGRARRFGERPEGEAFWYENSYGLAEIAANRASAAAALGLAPGQAVRVLDD